MPLNHKVDMCACVEITRSTCVHVLKSLGRHVCSLFPSLRWLIRNTCNIKLHERNMCIKIVQKKNQGQMSIISIKNSLKEASVHSHTNLGNRLRLNLLVLPHKINSKMTVGHALARFILKSAQKLL